MFYTKKGILLTLIAAALLTLLGLVIAVTTRIQAGPSTLDSDQSLTVNKPKVYNAGAKHFAVHNKVIAPLMDPLSHEPAASVYSDYDQKMVTLQLSLSSEDFGEREDAIEQLVDIGSHEALQALTVILESNSLNPRQIYLRELVVESLEGSFSHRSEGIEIRLLLLSSALTDFNPSIRLAATNALAGYPKEQSMLLLQQAVIDPDRTIRLAAAEVLEDWLEIDENSVF